MTISEFKADMIEQVKLAAATEKTSEKEEFINLVIETLVEAEELNDEFYFLPYEGSGPRKKSIQIDGYSYNELDECLSLFISPELIMESDSTITLTSTDAERSFSRVRAFIELSRYIIDNAEESAPGYGLACDIAGKYSDIHKYCIYLLTDMTMSKSIKTKDVGTLNGKPVEYHIWDIERLFLLADSRSGKEEIVIRIADYLPGGLPCLHASRTSDYEAYLCNIPGSLLASLYNEYGGRLLEGNVRSFLQTKGKVNKGIRATILNEPEMFFAYNNGIAATASDIAIEYEQGLAKITEIKSLQIVNGGQTTASLAMALIRDKRDNSEEQIGKIYVPMKLSLVSPEKAQQLIPNISRFANSQNKVSDADLWSNHPFHVRVESFSRRSIAPATQGRQFGTYWYYERARGQYRSEIMKLTGSKKSKFEQSNPKQQMFDKTDLAKYFNIYLCLPHVASTGGQKSFAKFAEWANKQWEKDDNVFNESFFRRIVSLAIIFRQSDRIVKNQTWYNSYKANIVAYTISKIIHTVKTMYSDRAIDYRSIWQKQTLSKAWISQIERTSKDMYEVLIDEGRTVENVTEWAKRETCWQRAILHSSDLNREFTEELTYKRRELEQLNDAHTEQKQVKKASVMIDVANYGMEKWKALYDWASTHDGLNPIDMDMITSALHMETHAFPSEKQCQKIMAVLEKARLEGYPG